MDDPMVVALLWVLAFTVLALLIRGSERASSRHREHLDEFGTVRSFREYVVRSFTRWREG